MIQRIQSVYLALASLAMAVTAFLPWVKYYLNDETIVLKAITDHEYIMAWPLAFIISMSFAVLVISIFQYSNRKLQMKSVALGIWLSVLSEVVFLGVHYYDVAEMSKVGEVHLDYQFAVALPLIAAILAWMGKKAIKKDEDLVKSVDRLR